MKRALFSFLLIALALTSFAQNRKADSLLQLIAHADDRAKAPLYNDLAALYRQSDPSKNIEYSSKALEFAQRANDRPQEGLAYSNLGFAWYVKGDYDRSADFTGKAIAIGKDIGDKKLLGACYNTLALLNQNQGNIDKSLDNFLLALQNREAAGDSMGIAATCNNLGDVYRTFNRYKEALATLHKAEAIYKKLGNKNGLGSAYSNIGNVYFAQGDNGSAIFYFEQSITLRRQMGNKRGLAIVLGNLSEAYIQEKDYTHALLAIREALSISSELGDPLAYTGHLMTLARTYSRMDSLARARTIITQVVDTLKKLNFAPQLENAERYYAEILHMNGDDRTAYSALLRAMNIHDSVFNNETGSRIAFLQSEIEKEKREAEVKLQEEADKRQRTVLLLGIALLIAAALFLFSRYRIKNRAAITLEEQNRVIAQKNKEISDSIDYAKKIQRAILPLPRDLEKVFPSGFGIYSPKDIVSGDFYWFVEHADKFFIAGADCTGHGVPGAFMSLLGSDKLTNAVKDKGLTKPSGILGELNKQIRDTLRQKDVNSELRDGMDIALCCFDFKNRKVEYAGANRPLYQVSAGKLTVHAPTKAAIGGFTTDEQVYANVELELRAGDTFYMFTDGLTDQFGGEEGKKFSSKRLRETLLALQDMKMSEQEKKLVAVIEEWMHAGGKQYEQVDDILLIGIRI